MTAIFVLIAALAGMTSALQSGSNQMLQKTLEAPLWSVVFVSAITLLAALPLPFLAGERMPGASMLAHTPWWAWIGGLFGLGFVLATVYASPKLGAGLFVGLIVTVSTVASLLLDHFGWLGFDIHTAGVGRIAGALLMIAGVY